MDDDVRDEELVRLVRTVQDHDRERFEVPADLWSRIEAEVGREREASTMERQTSVGEPAAPVVELASRRRRPGRLLGAAGIVGIAASLAAAVWLVARDDDSGRELAAVDLSNDGLASFTIEPSGSARLIDDGGRLYLEVELDDAPQVGGEYIELWLIDRNVAGMVSLGPYHGNDRYEVPVGVDPGSYPVVDVSLEPVDGVPTHSGVSVVRGVLPA